MVKVNLYAKDGSHVVPIAMPDLPVPPDCIVWQNRFFFKNVTWIEKKDKEGYYEGFAVVAIPAIRESILREANRPKKDKMDDTVYGNDDLLIGLPNDLDEAIETFLEFYSSREDFGILDDIQEDEFIASAHHVADQFIRNSWYLWYFEGHKYNEWPTSKPKIVEWFNDRGIFHADDMSGIIMRSAYRKHNGLPIALEQQIEIFKNFWKNNGFPEGIYKPK